MFQVCILWCCAKLKSPHHSCPCFHRAPLCVWNTSEVSVSIMFEQQVLWALQDVGGKEISVEFLIISHNCTIAVIYLIPT